MKQAMKRVKNILGDKKGDSMRKTMVLMTISSLLLSGAVVAVEGGGKAGASAGPVKSRTFNVLNYGAVGDDKTDNTDAFSSCLKDVIAAGGGRMMIPDGIYRGRIIIPGTKEWITIEIAGESEPTNTPAITPLSAAASHPQKPSSAGMRAGTAAFCASVS